MIPSQSVRPVRAPWLHPVTDASTRALIERVRRAPIYQSGEAVAPTPGAEVLPAAERLQRMAGPRDA